MPPSLVLWAPSIEFPFPFFSLQIELSKGAYSLMEWPPPSTSSTIFPFFLKQVLLFNQKSNLPLIYPCGPKYLPIKRKFLLKKVDFSFNFRFLVFFKFLSEKHKNIYRGNILPVEILAWAFYHVLSFLLKLKF